MLLTLDELPLPSSAPPLAVGAVDLWSFAYEEAMSDPEVARSYDELLSDDERARCQAFVRESDRTMFRATRALVRTSLSRYAQVEPHEWRFGRTPEGRPFTVAPRMAQPLYFNLSNTPALIVCAVSGHPSVGIDVEAVDATKPLDRLAQAHFSPAEVRALRELPEAQRVEHFYAYWTLKESYIKAKGVGLAMPLDRFSLLLDEERSPRIRFDPRMADHSTRWRFVRIAPARDQPGHLIAIAVETAGAPLTLRGCACVPLEPVEVRRSRAIWRRMVATGESATLEMENGPESAPHSQRFVSLRRIGCLKVDD